jgi:hypothetical protein
MQRRVHGERATVPELDAWMAQSSDLLFAEFATRLSADFDNPGAHALAALALDFWTWQRLEPLGPWTDQLAATGSGRTTTVSAIAMISSHGSSAFSACARIASGLSAS